jgi:hypothetical protein
MCVMMILRISFLPRIFRSHPRRRNGSKPHIFIIERETTKRIHFSL